MQKSPLIVQDELNLGIGKVSAIDAIWWCGNQKHEFFGFLRISRKWKKQDKRGE
jgi:hypothetical protein